ncbi:hypothetical protein Tco_1280861, partial [Tanacetum coccineum]
MDVAAMKHMASNFAKLDKFEGVDFRRWQKKMHFLFSSMSLLYVLTTPILEDGDDASVEQLKKRNKPVIPAYGGFREGKRGSSAQLFIPELMSVIESLQRKTKEMEENAVSKEEMLKTNEKNDEGEDAEDDNS